MYVREFVWVLVFFDSFFDEVSIDFVYVEGEILFLLVDDYLRFLFVELVFLMFVSVVIFKLD